MPDLASLVDQLSALSVIEASQLSKMLEEKWGVSAAAPVAVAAAAAAAPAEAAVEQTEFDVILAAIGEKKNKCNQRGKGDHQPRPEGGQGSRRGGAKAGQGRGEQGGGSKNQKAA